MNDDYINDILEKHLNDEKNDSDESGYTENEQEDVLSRMPEELKAEPEESAPLDEVQRKRRLRRKRKRIRPFGIFILVCIIAAIMASPIFAVREFKSNVSENYTKEELLNVLGFKEGMNIFRAKLMSGNKKLKANPYIEHGKISISLPGTVIITVEERKVRGNILKDGSYLYIDQHGRVLDIEETPNTASPIIEGLEFSEYSLGNVISVENTSSLAAAVSISQLMEKYNLSGYTINLNVSDIDNITAKINNAEITLGSTLRMDEKIRTLTAIIPNISPEAIGTLDLSDIDSQIVFKYMT
ncbi:MAG: FtsQ-type POTRA domain-containing protein [Firmicutes bacterium]|nr:FtsQ-type POTRA domain-containing protein [Bacillota bacterium]